MRLRPPPTCASRWHRGRSPRMLAAHPGNAWSCARRLLLIAWPTSWKYTVADQVAAVVVDALEAVDVGQQHCSMQPAARRPRAARRACRGTRAVAQSGQRVALRLVTQAHQRRRVVEAGGCVRAEELERLRFGRLQLVGIVLAAIRIPRRRLRANQRHDHDRARRCAEALGADEARAHRVARRCSRTPRCRRAVEPSEVEIARCRAAQRVGQRSRRLRDASARRRSKRSGDRAESRPDTSIAASTHAGRGEHRVRARARQHRRVALPARCGDCEIRRAELDRAGAGRGVPRCASSSSMSAGSGLERLDVQRSKTLVADDDGNAASRRTTPGIASR